MIKSGRRNQVSVMKWLCGLGFFALFGGIYETDEKVLFYIVQEKEEILKPQ